MKNTKTTRPRCQQQCRKNYTYCQEERSMKAVINYPKRQRGNIDVPPVLRRQRSGAAELDSRIIPIKIKKKKTRNITSKRKTTKGSGASPHLPPIPPKGAGGGGGFLWGTKLHLLSYERRRYGEVLVKRSVEQNRGGEWRKEENKKRSRADKRGRNERKASREKRRRTITTRPHRWPKKGRSRGRVHSWKYKKVGGIFFFFFKLLTLLSRVKSRVRGTLRTALPRRNCTALLFTHLITFFFMFIFFFF